MFTLANALRYLLVASECAALMAFWRWDIYLWAFRAYLLVSIVAGITWHPSMNAQWWAHWMLVFEPLRLLLMTGAIAEAGYYATTRMFLTERRALVTCLAALSMIAAVIEWHALRSTLGVIIGCWQAVKVAQAFFALGGCLYLWAKPIKGVTPWVRRHSWLLSGYLILGASASVAGSFVTTRLQWEAVNETYMCCGIICMLAWIVMVITTRSPARIPEPRS